MVRRALAMATGEQYLRLAINFGSIAAVSRLLTPAEVGISVIGTGVMAILLGLREFATSDFLIQRREVHRDDIRTSFTVLFLLTALIVVAISFLAPFLAEFYGEAKLALFLRVAAGAALIEAVSLPITGLLRRDMAFGKLAFINTTAVTVTAVATVLLALAGFGFMSVAWATMAGAGTTTILSFYVRPDLSNFRPALKSWRIVLGFGGYSGASLVIAQTYETLPQLVLGGILPPSAVGLYNRAMMVSQIPQMIFLRSVFSVSTPAFAGEARQGHSLKEPYLRALGYITVLYWPALALLGLLSYPVVSLLLGQQWLSLVPLLQVMAVAHVAGFPVILTAPVLLAVGANRDRVLVHLVARPVSALILCSAAYFGIMTMALSQLVIIPYLMVVALYFVRRHVAFGWRDLGAAVWKSAVVAAASAVGPIGVVMLGHANFSLSMGATIVAALLAATGWLAAILMTRHPILLELRKAIDAIAMMAMAAGRYWRPGGRIPALHARADQAR